MVNLELLIFHVAPDENSPFTGKAEFTIDLKKYCLKKLRLSGWAYTKDLIP
jgi:hypothetical protein